MENPLIASPNPFLVKIEVDQALLKQRVTEQINLHPDTVRQQLMQTIYPLLTDAAGQIRRSLTSLFPAETTWENWAALENEIDQQIEVWWLEQSNPPQPLNL